MATNSRRPRYGFSTSILSFSIALLSSSCGSRPDSSIYETNTQIEPLIVAMGGYNSCKSEDPKKANEVDVNPLGNGPLGMGLFKPFNALKTLLNDKYGIKARYIVSCFESGSSANVRSTSAPDQLKTIDPKDFPKLIATEMRRGSPIYLVGHSHGGWLSLQNTLALAEEVTIDGLFSTDPISRVHCNPPAITGCTVFPQDIDEAKQISIKGATGYWLNTWQTSTFYLRSGPAKHADENIKINASHSSMDIHKSLWDKIQEKVTENL